MTHITIIPPPSNCIKLKDSSKKIVANSAPNRGSLPMSNDTRVADSRRTA